MSDQVLLSGQAAAAAAAALDWQYGYTASAGEITMVGAATTGDIGLTARPQLTGEDMEADTYTLAYGREKILTTGHEQVAFVSHGGVHAQQLVAAAADAGACTGVHIEHGHAWARTPGQLWEHIGATPDVADEMIMAGYQPPQPSLEDRQQQLTPQHPVGDLPAASASSLDEMLPGTRIQAAVTALDDLAENQADWEAHVAIAAHCITSDPIVRDGVAVEASHHPGQRRALIETYRYAPTDQRAGCAAAAGMAMHFSGSSSMTTRMVADHAASDPTHFAVAQMATEAAEAGVYGPNVRAQLEAQLPEALEAAERAWQQERDITNQFTTMQMHRNLASAGPEL